MYASYSQNKIKQRRIGLVGLVLFGVIVASLIIGKKVDYWALKNIFVPSQDVEVIESVVLDEAEVLFNVHQVPVKVRGIYVPASKINKLEELINLANTTKVNAFIIDIKNDYGYLTFDSDNPVLQEVQAISKNPAIDDITEVMDKLYESNIYPIARIVAFKDNIVGETYPERVMQTLEGEVYKTKDGQMWLNPYDKRNWEYLVEVCKEAISAGFKEIQLDYMRFHESMDSERVLLPEDKSKTEIITEFTQYMYDAISPYGVYLSGDVFGTIITSPIDAEIVGQDYKELVKILDYICPMIYPSHYAEGSFGIVNPDLDPYRLILKALQASTDVIQEIPRSERKAIVRPWLQDFTATWLTTYQNYEAKQIQDQIRGVEDALLDEWILWNGAANYTQEALIEE
jgi:hypothetical protein